MTNEQKSSMHGNVKNEPSEYFTNEMSSSDQKVQLILEHDNDEKLQVRILFI
jgi:hypothetical protein